MVENRYRKNTIIILVVSAILTLFTFIFVDHHLGTPDRVQQGRTTLLSGGSTMAPATTKAPE